MNNDDDNNVVPIERGRAHVIESFGAESTRKPITLRSVLRTLTLFTVGQYFADEWFGESGNFATEPIVPIDEGFAIEGQDIKCQICFDFFAAHHVVQCRQALGHTICRTCFEKNAQQCVALCDVVCPSPRCKSLYDDAVLEFFLSQSLYTKLLQQQSARDKAVAVASGVERALYCKCGFVAVVEKDCVGDSTVKCVCGEIYCLKCGNYAHAGSLCPPPAKTLRALDQNWIAQNAKQCPNCAHAIEKNGGCEHMTCAQCKTEFCWTCMGRWPRCNCRRRI